MVGKMYIYLRDGQSKNWTSLNLQSAQIDHLNTLLARGSAASRGGGGKSMIMIPALGAKLNFMEEVNPTVCGSIFPRLKPKQRLNWL